MELVRECGDIVNMDEQEDGGLLNILIISLSFQSGTFALRFWVILLGFLSNLQALQT